MGYQNLCNKRINFKKMLIGFFWCLIIFSFFKPVCLSFLSNFVIIDKIYDVTRIIFSLFIIVYSFIKLKYVTKTIFLLICFELILVMSTMLSNGNLMAILVQSVSILSMCILLDYFIQKDRTEIFKYFFIVLFLLVIIDFVFDLLYPSGLGLDDVYWTPYYFLASKNGYAKYYIPLIIFSALTYKNENKKLGLLFYISIIIMIYKTIRLESTTTLLGVIISTILLLINQFKTKIAINISKVLIISSIIITFILCFLGLNSFFNDILSKFVSEDKLSNFIAREEIWEQAVKMFLNRPFYGYGYPNDGGFINYHGKQMYSHNGILEILLYGGILALFMFIFLLIKSFSIKNKRFEILSSPFIIGLATFFVMMIDETYISSISFYLFIVGFASLNNKQHFLLLMENSYASK